ncbi:MAG: DUF4400 domain-containing protein [Methylothermaceae bacterium]|nr:DUF4400 domain-containing protein [Methylothermaceae bacterium]
MRFLAAALLILVEFIVVSAAMPASLIDWCDRVDNAWMVGWYGKENTRTFRSSATRSFKGLFVDTGIVDFSYRMALPSRKEWEDAGPFVHIEDSLGIYGFLENRLNVFWREIAQIVDRFMQLGLWLAALSVMWLGHAQDGLAIRKLKGKTFGYASPFYHRYGIYFTGWLWVALIVWILLPLPMHPLVFPAVILIQGALINVIAMNLQKKV